MTDLARRRAALALAATALAPTICRAQAGARTVRFVVPFPAGGATDLIARTLAPRLADALGASIVVDNKPGAGGSLGSDIVAKAAPDGQTLLLATSSTHAIGPLLAAKLPYDAVRDFTPIAHVGDAPSIMLVPAEAPARSVREWIERAKLRPGALNYGSSGNGTIVQLTAELFSAQAGVSMTHVPYKGTALAIPDLITGQLDVMFDSLPTGMPHVRERRLRALAVTSAARSPLAPELPAVAETLPGFESTTWFGLYGPRGLPADAVARIEAALRQALADAPTRQRLHDLGVEPAPPGTPAQFARTVADDRAKWKRLIAERGIVGS